MLYQRWLEIARRQGGHLAVVDGATDQSYSFEELARRVEALPPATGPVIARSGDLQFLPEILRAWRDRQPAIPVERGAGDPNLPGQIGSDVSLVKYTPGARGIPRGIHFSAKSLLAEARRLVTAMEMSPARPNLAVISQAHSYGFSNLVLPLLLHGIPMHVLPNPFPQNVSAAFAVHDSLTVPAVPSIWRAWFRSGVLTHSPIASAISAGAPLSLTLEKQVHADTGIKLRNFYGASECGGISLDTSDTPRDDPADVGEMLDGVVVSVDLSNRLLVESDAVGLGYESSLPDDLLGEGRFLTQDVGRIEGHRVFLDRCAGGAINVAGRKVSPMKVEAALIATGLPERVRVFGLPSTDPDRVETIVGIVQLPTGATLEALKHAAVETIPAWEVPRRWWTNPPEAAWTESLAELRQRLSRTDFR